MSRLWTPEDLMEACRARMPKVFRQIDTALADPALLPDERNKIRKLLRAPGGQEPHIIYDDIIPIDEAHECEVIPWQAIR